MLLKQLEQFWEQEEVPERRYAKDEEACESYFVNTFRRNDNRRFIVRLPKRENVILGDSEKQAQRKLMADLAKILNWSKHMRNFYEITRNKDIMSLITEEMQDASFEVFYLSHQPVIKPDSVTSGLRCFRVDDIGHISQQQIDGWTQSASRSF